MKREKYMSGFFSEPNDYPPKQAEMEEKIRQGNFWNKDGALADARELACLSLCQFRISDALLVLMHVHAMASGYAERIAKDCRYSVPPEKEYPLWKRRFRRSKFAARLYGTIWHISSLCSRIG